ncbi:hypothetical protein IPG36_02680 [bacterium]|nr:MAG: hypothetical protein IPG36_02680 [bacterium]
MLLEGNYLLAEKLDAMRVEAEKAHKPLIAYIAEQGIVKEEDLTRLSAVAMGVPYVNLMNMTVPDEVTKMLPRSTAETYMAVPFGMQQGKLAVAMLDPTNIQAVDFLSRKVGSTVTVYLASRASIDRVLGQFHSDVAADVASAIDVARVDDHPRLQSKMRNRCKIWFRMRLLPGHSMPF